MFYLYICAYMEEKQVIKSEYKPGPIDSMIVSTLQSLDRGSF